MEEELAAELVLDFGMDERKELGLASFLAVRDLANFALVEELELISTFYYAYL